MDKDINLGTKSMKSVGEIMNNNSFKDPTNVNDVDKNNLNNVKTLDINVENIEGEERIKYNAENLAAKLDDLKNLNYYLKMCREHKPEFLYECLSITSMAKREERIKKTPAKYFVGVLKKRAGKK